MKKLECISVLEQVLNSALVFHTQNKEDEIYM